MVQLMKSAEMLIWKGFQPIAILHPQANISRNEAKNATRQ